MNSILSTLLNLLAVIVGIYLLLSIFLYFRQGSMLFLPDMPSREVVQTPAAAGMDYEDLQLETEDGETLQGWFVPAAEDTERTVLIFHGNAGNISHRLDTLRIWHRLGFNSLIIDYRGYGESSGSPSEPGLYTDARTAWQHLVESRGIAAGEIILFGRSLGGAVAARLATEVEPAALIVESSFTSVPDAAADIYWWLPVRWLSRFEFATKEYVQAVDCPVLVVHSRDDEIIPFSHGRAIFEAASEPKQFIELRGGHNEAIFESRDRYLEGLRVFADQMYGGLAEGVTRRD